MIKMTFKREQGKQLMARVVEPGMMTAATTMYMSQEVVDQPVVEVFDTEYATHVDRTGKAYGYMLASEPLGDFIERLEENPFGINFSKDVVVDQWSLSASQCKRLLGVLREYQETYENDQLPGLAI